MTFAGTTRAAHAAGPDTWTLDFDFNRAVIDELVEADLAFLAKLEANNSTWCGA